MSSLWVYTIWARGCVSKSDQPMSPQQTMQQMGSPTQRLPLRQEEDSFTRGVSHSTREIKRGRGRERSREVERGREREVEREGGRERGRDKRIRTHAYRHTMESVKVTPGALLVVTKITLPLFHGEHFPFEEINNSVCRCVVLHAQDTDRCATSRFRQQG